MDSVNSAMVMNASAAEMGSVEGAASLMVLKKAMNQQESSAAELIAALPQPPLATSGSLGTRVNTYA